MRRMHMMRSCKGLKQCLSWRLESKSFGMAGSQFAARMAREVAEIAEIAPKVLMTDWPVGSPSRALQAVELQAEAELGACKRLEKSVIFGTICVEPLQAGATIATAVYDGSLYASLVVYNAATSVCNPSELFPVGATVALKEPVLTKARGRSPVIELPCSSVDFFFQQHKDTQRLGEQEAKEIRLEGNKLFSKGSFILAAQRYSSCISGLEAQGEEYVLARSNRAQCFLQLKRYDDAIIDCNKALDVDPHHVKSNHRKGAALMELQEFRQALGCLEAAGSGGAADKERVQRCKLLLEQAKLGNHDISGFLLSGLDDKAAPELADYIGPVEVKLTKDGRDRGVFMTRDVEVGELLIVSNAAVFVERPGDNDGMVEAARACAASARALQQVYALPDRNGIRNLPDMKLFGSNAGYWGDMRNKEKDEGLDLDRIRKVLSKASFAETSGMGRGRKSQQVWALPGFINHSCLPNASKLDVGKATLVRASRKLKAGDELVICYTEALTPHQLRKSLCYTSFGFYCKCERCKLEEQHEALLSQIPNIWEELKNPMPKEKLLVELSKLSLAVEETLDKIGNLQEEQKNWIRAGFLEAYGMAASKLNQDILQRHFPAAKMKRFLPAVKFMKLAHDVAPGYFKTTMAVARCFTRDLSDEAAAILEEEFKAAFGPQPMAVETRLLQWYNDDESLAKRLSYT